MPDWKGDVVASWEAARKQAGLKEGTHLTARLKEAQAALKEADGNPAKKPAAVATLQKVVDNIDTQLGEKPAPGLALYLRQMKSGAKARMA